MPSTEWWAVLAKMCLPTPLPRTAQSESAFEDQKWAFFNTLPWWVGYAMLSENHPLSINSVLLFTCPVRSSVWARQTLARITCIRRKFNTGGCFTFHFLASYLPLWLRPPLHTPLARSRYLAWAPWRASPWLPLNESEILLEKPTEG